MLVATCTWSVLVGAVAAQDVRWRLPPGGAIQWQSTEAETCHAIDDPKRRAAPPHGTQPHAALLLANELDKDARATTVHLHDVRWLAPRLACDLGTFGKGRNVDLVVDDIVPFQPFRLRGTIADAAADGTQTMTFELVAAPAPAARERKRLAEKEPARQVHFDGSCTGSLRLQRKVDATAGIVAEFTAEVTLRIAYSPRYPVPNCDYVLRQTWTAAEVRTRRQAGFEAAVADAIRRGAENVRHELAIPDRGLLQPGPDQPSGEGYLALGLLTLLHAEVGADDTVVRQGFAE
ncbi:MAG: hypothetical protein JNK15_12785, partial [Planctomycetes bacterium]|nr:hypothetical protein [Planctomycetota bacterium]